MDIQYTPICPTPHCTIRYNTIFRIRTKIISLYVATLIGWWLDFESVLTTICKSGRACLISIQVGPEIIFNRRTVTVRSKNLSQTYPARANICVHIRCYDLIKITNTLPHSYLWRTIYSHIGCPYVTINVDCYPRDIACYPKINVVKQNYFVIST